VIANLGLSDMPLSDSVVSLAQALTARDRIRLELDVEDAVDARADERDDLLRVLSEAVANAVRHGHASTIKVSLARRPGVGLSMSIADDGRGFDPRANHGSRGATGLDGMRARIDRHMGSLRVSSEPGGGTVVEVVLDQPRRPARRG
jgi:signal transduction histidine kinase